MITSTQSSTVIADVDEAEIVAKMTRKTDTDAIVAQILLGLLQEVLLCFSVSKILKENPSFLRFVEHLASH